MSERKPTAAPKDDKPTAQESGTATSSKPSPATAVAETPARTVELAGLTVSVTSLLGVVAAVCIALFLNVLAARHYRRWDVTSDKRYSLSPATVTTLSGLTQPVDIWILMSNGDPLRESVRQMLVAYGGETDKITAHYIDPDRDPAAYLDIKTRYRMDASRAAGAAGVASDAVVVVTQNDKHWFIAPTDLVEVASADDPRAKPREERALTGAIRNVTSGQKSDLCFTSGHGEIDTQDNGEQGLGFLIDLLEKDNYGARTIDTTVPNAKAPYKGCATVIVAGLRLPFGKEEEAQLRTYAMEGGSVLLAVSPVNADTDTGMAAPGVAQLLAPFGMALEEDLVFETDDRLVFPDSRGIRFGVAAKPHAVTQGLLLETNAPAPPRIIVHFARSLRAAASEGSASASDLLTTSVSSFGVTTIRGAKDWEGAPTPSPQDIKGPLVLAMASERPKLNAAASHGPRLVVIGTGSAMIRTNWRLDGQGRGMALLVENAIAWLSAKPQVLDVPDKQAQSAGIRITEDDKSQVFRYVIVYMPLALLVLALLVFFLRRSGEGAPWKGVS